MRFKSTLLLIIIISTALSLRITLYDSTFEGGQKTKNQCGLTTTTSTSTSTSSTSPLTTPTTTETTPKWTTTQATDETSTKSSSSSSTTGEEEKITDSSTTPSKSATSTETSSTSPNVGSKSTVSLTTDEGTQESFSSSTKPTKTVSKTTTTEIANDASTVSSRPSLQTTQKASETPTSPNDASKTTDATIPSTTKSTPSDSTNEITKTSTETAHDASTVSSMPSRQTTQKASEKTPATPKLTTTIALDTAKSSTKSSPTTTGKTFAPSTPSSSAPTTLPKISTAPTVKSSTPLSVTTFAAQSSSSLNTSEATTTLHSTSTKKQFSPQMPSSTKVETLTTTANKSDSTSFSSPTSVQTTTTMPTLSATTSTKTKPSHLPSSTATNLLPTIAHLSAGPRSSSTSKFEVTSKIHTTAKGSSSTHEKSSFTSSKTTTTSDELETTTIIPQSELPEKSSSINDISTTTKLSDISTTKVSDETSVPSELSEKTTKTETTLSSPSTSTKIDYLSTAAATQSDGPKTTVTFEISQTNDDMSTSVDSSSTVDKYSGTTPVKTESPTESSTATKASTPLQTQEAVQTDTTTQTPVFLNGSKSEDSETTEMENDNTTTSMQSATGVSATLTSEKENVNSKTTSTSPVQNTTANDDSTNTVSMTTTTVVQSYDATTFDKSTETTTVPQSASTSVFDYSTKSVPDHDTTEDTPYETTKSERSETLQPPTTTAVVDKNDDRTVSTSTIVRASDSDSSTKSLSSDDTTKNAILQTAETTENLQSPNTTVVEKNDDGTVSPSTSARVTDLSSTISLSTTIPKETTTTSEIMVSSTSSNKFSKPQPTSQATTSTSVLTTTTATTSTESSPEDTKPFLFCALKPCASEFGYDGKVSFGYHDRIAILCKNGTFKSLKFKRIFSNGTEESQFTTLKNSTLNGNVWSIPVTDVLKNKFARNSINSFILNVELEDSNKEIRSWNYTIKNNQSPIPGGCFVSPSSFPAMTNVTFTCNGWSDSDGIKSYTFYKSIPSETTKLISIGTSSNSTAFYTLSEGTYIIYATATDTLSATSDKIFIQQITVTPAKVYQYCNNNETKTLSEIDAILDAFLKGTLVTDLVDDANILSAKQNLPKSVANFLDWALQNRNATPDQIENSIKTAFGNELSEYTNGLSQEAILALINKKLNQINDKKADVFGELLTDISKIPIRSTSDLVQVLQSTSSALRKSLSFTIDGTTFSDGIVLYARIHNSATNLILVNGYISAKNNIVYLEGDFRVAKFMQNNGIDSFDLKAGYKKMSADIYLYENDTSIMIASGQTQMFPVSSKLSLSFFGETTVSVDSKIYRQHLITAWKFSIDQSLPTYNTDQAIPNSTFTTFLPLSTNQGSSYLSFPTLTTSSIKAFMTGESLEIGESKLSFDILTKDSKTISTNMELKSGKLLFKKSNDKIVSLWIAEFEWINADSLKTATGYDWKEFIPETLKLENISSNFIQKLVPGSNMQILIEGVNQLPPILITGFEGEKELEIADASEWLLSSSLEISGKWKSVNEFKQTFRNGVRVNVSDGVLNFEGGSQIEFFDGFIQYSGSSLFYQPTISDTVMQLYNVQWGVVLNDGIIIFKIENGMSNKETNTQHFETIITLKDGAEIQLSGGILSRNSSYGYVISNAEISANGYQMSETGLKPQSLMNFEVQAALVRIMGNVTNALKNNGSDLSDEELASVESNVMQIAEDVSKSIEAAFQNPLDSILAKSLAYEKDNYDDIFNWLPLNPADIRYIEDFSNEEEWAEQAAAIRQIVYAKRSIYSMNAMISALEDVQVQKLLASGKTSGSISYSAGGTSMQVDIGKMSDLLSKIHSCNDWTLQLPTKLSDLNNPRLNESEIYRLSLICQETNVYMYTDNAYALITSGQNIKVKIKSLNSKICLIQHHENVFAATQNGKIPIKAWKTVERPPPKIPLTPQPQLKVTCDNGIIAINDTANLRRVQFQSGNSYTVIMPNSSTVSLELPTALVTASREFEVTYWNKQESSNISHVSCPAIDHCILIKPCWICTAELLNPECRPVKYLLMISNFISLMYIILHKICKRRRRRRNSGYEPLLPVVQKRRNSDVDVLLRYRKLSAAATSSHISTASAISPAIAISVICILLLPTAGADGEDLSITAKGQECTVNSHGFASCKISEVTQLTTSTTRTSTLLMNYDGRPLGSIKIRPEVHLTCQKSTKHFTRIVNMKTTSVKICGGRALCSGIECAQSTKQLAVPALGVANELPGNTVCVGTCGGWFCQCLTWGEACIYYRNFASPADTRALEVFECEGWHTNLILNVTITTQQSSTNRLLTLQEGHSTELNKIKFSALDVNPEDTPPTSKETFVSTGKTLAVLNDIGISAANLLKCSDIDAANAFNNCTLEDNCRCHPADGMITCSCLENTVLQKLLNEQSLPMFKGQHWLQPTDDKNVIAIIPAHPRIQITINEYQLFAAIDMNSCSATVHTFAGCSSCNEGATADITCSTDFGSAEAHVICPGLMSFPLKCSKDGTLQKVTLFFNQVNVDVECELRCPSKATKIHFAAILKKSTFINPWSRIKTDVNAEPPLLPAILEAASMFVQSSYTYMLITLGVAAVVAIIILKFII